MRAAALMRVIQTADLALLVAAVAVHVLERMLHLLLRGTVRTGLRTVVALGAIEDGTTLLMGADCALDTRHVLSLFLFD